MPNYSTVPNYYLCIMTDVHNRETRSYNMSRIKGKNTKPEILVRKFLFSTGFRYRLNDKKLPGKPDIVLPRYKTVIFIHGCFWHGHEGCKYYVVPKTHTDWWVNKIVYNISSFSKAITFFILQACQFILLLFCSLKPLNLFRTL